MTTVPYKTDDMTFIWLHSELSSNLTTFMQCCDATFFSSRIRSCQLWLIVYSTGQSGAAAEILEWVLGFHQSARGELRGGSYLKSVRTSHKPTSFLYISMAAHSTSLCSQWAYICFPFYFRPNLHLGSRSKWTRSGAGWVDLKQPVQSANLVHTDPWNPAPDATSEKHYPK